MAFDPDQYIAQKQGSSSDPDAYLAQRETASPGILEQGLGAIETIGTIGSSMIAEPLSGLAGLGASVLPGEQGQGAEAVSATREALTLGPRTEAGKQQVQAISDFLSPVVEVLEKAKRVSGDIGFDLAGPIGGALGETIPEALLEIIPA